MSFNQKLIHLLRWGVYLSLATPLVYTGFTIYPFIFGKTVFFRLVIELLAIPYAVLLLRAPQYRPKRSPLSIAVAAYLGILFVAALLGVDFWRSFWSNHERMMGLFTLGHVVILFFIAQSVFRTREDWQRLLGVSIGIAAVVSGIGIMQYFRPILFANPGGRIWSTLGNYIYLASYALFHFFFALILLVRERTWRKRALWAGAAALFLLTFAMTQTRGAFVALAVGSLFLPVFYGLAASKGRVRAAMLALFILIGVSGITLWRERDAEWVLRIPQLSRLTGITRAGGSARLLNWQIAANAFLARPLLGWGPENYYFAFNKFYDPQMYAHSSYESWQDHAHNIFLDTGNESGFIGIVSYLALFGVSFALLIRAARRRVVSIHTAAIGTTLLVVYFVQNFFVFDVLATWILFYLVLAFITSETSRETTVPATSRSGSEDTSGSRMTTPAPLSFPQSVLVMGGGVMVVIAAYFANISPLIVTASTIAAGRNYSTDFAGSMTKMERALELPSPYKAESREEYGKLVLMALQSPNFPREGVAQYVQRALLEFQNTVREHPSDAYARLTLAQWKFIAGSVLDPAYYLDTETELQKALALSPARQQVYYALIRFYILQGNFPQAVEFAKRMVDLAPNIQVSHWYYGEALARAGEKEGGYTEMLGALRGEFGPQGLNWNVPEMEYFVSLARDVGARLNADWYEAILLLQKGDHTGALAGMEKALAAGYRLVGVDASILDGYLGRNPEDAELRFLLARAFVASGDVKSGKSHLYYLSQHSPSYAARIQELLAGIQ